ncbi:MAG: hypothetical protein KBA61_11110 [Spirochaetes bacterium]|nr:hypothetical protein [Spirochaetota bacterium]
MPDTNDRRKPRCPGAANVRTPELTVKQCPACGGTIEIFSDETTARCGRCGTEIFRSLESCARWCRYAEECLGEEEFARLREKFNGER